MPPALSELCLRLLARETHARVPNAEALCLALETLLEEAKADPRWEMALCYGWTVDGRTTEDAPELVGHDPQAWLRRWIRQKPKRGRPPAPPVVAPAPPAEPPPPPEPPTATTLPTPRTRVSRAVPVLVVGLVLAVGFLLGQLRPTPHAPTPSPVPGPPVLTSPFPAESSLDSPTPWATHVHEVAPPWKPPEADAGAAPPRADTPAPVTPVTRGKGTIRMKKQAPGSQARQDKQGNGSTLLLAVAATANLACPGAQVREEPAPQACPAGAVETMTRQLGLEIGDRHSADMPGAPRWASPVRVPVKQGPVSLELAGAWKAGADAMGRGGRVVLPDSTRLSGQLYIGEKRVYGRITQAITPTGDTLTVCMELVNPYSGARGVEFEPDGGAIKVRPYVEVKTVERFE